MRHLAFDLGASGVKPFAGTLKRKWLNLERDMRIIEWNHRRVFRHYEIFSVNDGLP